MKYIREFGIIIVISLIGELLNYLIPLPIPSSIYGLVIMFLCLHFKIVKIADVKKTAVFLIEIMPLMFIPAAVGIIESWDIIKPNVIAYAIITIVSKYQTSIDKYSINLLYFLWILLFYIIRVSLFSFNYVS